MFGPKTTGSLIEHLAQRIELLTIALIDLDQWRELIDDRDKDDIMGGRDQARFKLRLAILARSYVIVLETNKSRSYRDICKQAVAECNKNHNLSTRDGKKIKQMNTEF